MRKSAIYDIGDLYSPFEDPENINHYIAAACKASRELWDIITEYKAFERAQAKATPKELLLFRVALEYLREPLREVENMTATGAEIAQSIGELEKIKRLVA